MSYELTLASFLAVAITANAVFWYLAVRYQANHGCQVFFIHITLSALSFIGAFFFWEGSTLLLSDEASNKAIAGAAVAFFSPITAAMIHQAWNYKKPF